MSELSRIYLELMEVMEDTRENAEALHQLFNLIQSFEQMECNPARIVYITAGWDLVSSITLNNK